MTNVGVLIFKNLFLAHPGAVQLFPFQNTDGSINDAKVRTHSLTAIGALGYVIMGLQNTTETITILERLVWCESE